MAPRHYDDPRYPTGRQDDDLSRDYGARHEPRSWGQADSSYGRGYGRNQGYQQGASTTQGGFRPGEWGQDEPGRHGGGAYGQGSYGQGAYGQGSHDRPWDEPHRHAGHGDATGRYGHQRMGQGGMMNQGRYDEPQQYYGVQGRHSQFADDRYGAGDTHAYGRGAPEISRGYAPGSQIWESQGQGPEFEPDYLHWRESQMRNLDRDYQSWREERRQKFSQDFDEWRSRRAQASGETQNPTANPAVGDVADGGTGRDDRKK